MGSSATQSKNTVTIAERKSNVKTRMAPRGARWSVEGCSPGAPVYTNCERMVEECAENESQLRVEFGISSRSETCCSQSNFQQCKRTAEKEKESRHRKHTWNMINYKQALAKLNAIREPSQEEEQHKIDQFVNFRNSGKQDTSAELEGVSTASSQGNKPRCCSSSYCSRMQTNLEFP